MILFKACSRCRGDLDATFQDDVYCVQCGFRPALSPQQRKTARTGPGTSVSCRSCGSDHAAQLERLNERDHTCYRCRVCGHIFSPGTGQSKSRKPMSTQPS